MKKRVAIFFGSLLCVALSALGVYSMSLNSRNAYLERYIEENKHRAFFELVSSVAAMDISLKKSLYATSPAVAGAICIDVFGRAVAAQTALDALPLPDGEYERIGGFIGEVGDYAYTLSRAAATGRDYTLKERADLRKFSETASALSQELLNMQATMFDGELSVKPDESEFFDHYDSSVENMLKNGRIADENTARAAAAKFLGMKRGMVYPSDYVEGKLPCYYFSAERGGGEVTVGISKRGAKVVSMLSECVAGEMRLSLREGVEQARRFLDEQGFHNMKKIRHTLWDGVLTADFVYEQDGVLCYADLVRVGVDMGTGRVCSLAAESYVLNHRERELKLEEIVVDATSARENLTSGLTVLSEALALIPATGQHEPLCHEFVCKASDGRKVVVYINAATGEQEQLMILIEDAAGTQML